MDARLLDDTLAAGVADGLTPGVVATVADRSGSVYEGVAGVVSAGGDEALAADAVYRLASMTKPVTAVAAMQVVESGGVTLDTPVGDVLPAFDELPVLDGFDGDSPRLRPARARATVRQLLNHTAGLCYWIWNADMLRYTEVTGLPDMLQGVKKSLEAPLVRDPGTRWEYSTAVDWTGQLVEALSGLTLDKYMADRIFEPLGMVHTGMQPADGDRPRVVPVHAVTPDGTVATELDWHPAPEFWPGGHGLYSTPQDYQRFSRMLLRGGELDGNRILEPGTVDAMFTDSLGDLTLEDLPTALPEYSDPYPMPKEDRWGLGLQLAGIDRPHKRSTGSGSWAGLFNTYFWVDRERDLTASIFMQQVPFFTPGAAQLLDAFETAVYR